MKAQVIAVYENIGKADFKTKEGDVVDYNALLVRDPDQMNPKFAMCSFSVPNEVYDTYSAPELESFKGKEVVLSGALMSRYNGGYRFVVQKIELSKK